MGNEFNKDISKAYLETYIQARYYNFDVNEKQKIFYRRIYLALKQQYVNLLKEDTKKQKAIKYMLEIYQYIFYIDNVRPINDLKAFVDLIYEKRIKLFGVKPEPKFKVNLYKLIKDGIDKKTKFLKEYDTDEFLLSINKFPIIKDLYNADLDYNFKIPYIYSENAIYDVFNENVINEDKLLIEYHLLTVKCIKEVIEGNFKTKYTLAFSMTFFKKKNKLSQILKIINNQIILDKIKLKISYSDFIKHKTQIYNLMQEGYKFAVALDEKFKVDRDNVTKLNIFDFIIVNEKIKYYEDLLEYEEILPNLVVNND